MRIVRWIEGVMPVQLLLELAVLFGVATLAAYLLRRWGWPLNRLFQALSAFAIVYAYFRYRVYPPLSASVITMTMGVAALAVWGWASATEESWSQVRAPIIKLLDAETVMTRGIRAGILVLLPILVGGAAMKWMWPADPDVNGPIELGIFHPAPPQTVTVFAPEGFRR